MRLARILRLVDQNMIDAAIELVERPGRAAVACQQRARAFDHVVEVEHAAHALQRFVALQASRGEPQQSGGTVARIDRA